MTRANPPKGMISIGALSRASGIPVPTLRTWERRYGYPTPVRKPSGHRLYPLSGVARLRRMAEAIHLGHRVGDLVPLRDEDLQRILRADRERATAESGNARVGEAPVPGEPLYPAASIAESLKAARRFDSPLFMRHLLQAWARLGPVRFLDDWVAPLLHEVGSAWRDGRLEIRHEHFVSERIHDFLRSSRLPQEERAGGPLVVLATVAGEEHGIGLEMAALILAHAGLSPLLLGTGLPEDEIASAARERRARGVAVGFSEHMPDPERREKLRRLRSLLPSRVRLLVGGAGAPHLPGTVPFRSFGDLERWARGEAGSAAV